MGAIVNLSDAVNRLTGGNSGTPESLWWHKVARVGGAAPVAVPIAGRGYSLWTYDGFPGAGAAPTTWANPTNTTAGGLLQTDPGGGRQKWLMQFGAVPITPGSLILYDRLGAIGNLSGTSTSAQTFTGTTSRYTTGAGVMAFYEIYGNTTTILGATATTVTISYTNQAGTAGRTSTAVQIGGTGFREGAQVRAIPLQSGDTGVRSVQSATLAATTGTVGAWGITLAKILAVSSSTVAGLGGWRDFVTGLPSIPEVLTGACLGLLFIPSTTTAPEFFGCAGFVEA